MFLMLMTQAEPAIKSSSIDQTTTLMRYAGCGSRWSRLMTRAVELWVFQVDNKQVGKRRGQRGLRRGAGRGNLV